VQARLSGQGDHVIHAHGVPMHGGTRLIVAIADVAPIKRAERAREELLAFVSHDLRSPATSIALLAEMHLAGRGTLEPVALLHEVRRLAQRTLSLADDFVRVAQASQRPLQRELRDMQALLAEAVADCQPQADAASVHLQLLPPPAPNALVSMDTALVLRAVGNLLSNAVKNSPAGAAVALSALPRPDGGGVITVSDRGPGLDPAAIDRLQQVHDGLVPVDGRGVGFGLLFVQRVAARHGGQLQVRRGDDGVGAVFELVIGPASGNP
jgi:hypothetical protein